MRWKRVKSIAVGALMLVCITVVGFGWVSSWHTTTAVITVEKNEYVTAGKAAGYAIQTTTGDGKEDFIVQNDLFRGHGFYWSTDMAAQLKVGKRYKVECSGYRGFGGRSIVSAEELPD